MCEIAEFSEVMLILLRNVIGLPIHLNGVPVVSLVTLRSTLGWFATLPTLLWLATLTLVGVGLGVFLEIVVYLTHRPVVEHRVIHTTVRHLHDQLGRTCDCAVNVLNDVVHYKVSGQVRHLRVLFEHSLTERYLLQRNVQVLVKYQSTHLWFAIYALQKRARIFLVHTIGIRGEVGVNHLSLTHEHHT